MIFVAYLKSHWKMKCLSGLPDTSTFHLFGDEVEAVA